MKQTFHRTLLLVMLLIATCTSTFAEVLTGKCGSKLTYIFDTETGELKIEGSGAMNNWYYQKCPWYSVRKQITKIEIPNGVTNIGDYAFDECNGLTSIIIPNSVTKIGDFAFSRCSGLTSITIPESVTSIGRNAFQCCSGLTSITIPESVTNIGDRAFIDCDGLPQPIIVNNMFAHLPKVYKGSYVIPEGIERIVGGAFEDVSGLTSITIPNSVTYIGDYAFYGCSGLTSINIQNNVTSIGNNVFTNCGLRVVYWDSKEDYSSTCARNGYLQEFYFGDNVTFVDNSFSYCKQLRKVVLGKNITQLRAEVFKGTSINEFYVTGKEMPICYPDVFTDVALGNATLYVPSGMAETYRATEPWSGFGTILELPDPRDEIIANLQALYDEYASYTFKAGTEVGQYGKDEVKAFNAAKYEANNILTDDSEYTDEQIQAALEELKRAYLAVLASKVEAFEIADGTELDMQESHSYSKVCYTRNFVNTDWQALYLPMAVPVSAFTEQDLQVAFINNFNQYDTDGDHQPDQLVMEIFYIDEGALLPNTPYMVKASTTGEKQIVVDNAEVKATEENTISCSSMTYNYDVIGNYHNIPASELNAGNCYTVSDGSLKQQVGDLCAERWYLKITPRGNMYTTLPQEIKIQVYGEEEIDGIKNIETTNRNQMYDLSGRKVSKAQKGIYIQNGKKLLVK